MGFFERFSREWGNLEFRWADAGAHLSGSWDAVKRSTLESNAVYANLWNTAFGGKDGKENAEAFWAEKSLVDRIVDQPAAIGEAVAGPFAAMAEMPGLRQAFAFADAAQHDLVQRPLATANLVRAESFRNPGAALEGDTWRNAYNSSSYVTPGQAFTYAMFDNLQAFWGMFGLELDEQQRKMVMEQFPTLGIIAQDPKNFDPRDREGGRRAYYENNFMKSLSGTLDVGIVLGLDPTVAGGKLAAAGKARYISNEMSTAALQSGKLETWVDSKSYRRAKRFINEADNSEEVRRRMFNNHYDGDLAAALLFDAGRMQRDYSRRGGQLDLYDTTFRALYGDVNAWDDLTREASSLADVIGHERANYTIANAAKNYGTGDKRVDSRMDDLVESKTQAWVDATINGYGMWGKLGEGVSAGGMLTGTNAPRLTATSAWRAGAYSLLRSTTPTTVGHWARRSRWLLPSQRSGRMLDLDDANSVSVFRNALATSRLDQHELDRWVSAYSRATSPEGRFRIYNAAENYTYRVHAEEYGLSASDIDKLVPTMNRYRRGNRQILSRSRRYASEDVRKAYERRLQENNLASAERLQTLQHQIDEAAKRGEFPESYYALPDDNGLLTLIPEDSALRLDESKNLRLDQPITNTQHGKTVPLQDWNVLENALWWHVGFGKGRPKTRSSKRGLQDTWTAKVGKTVYGAQDITRAALESVMSAWKVTAIMRPGYVPRTLSDEVGRIWVKQKAFGTMSSMGRAAGYTAQNMWSRTRLLGEAMSSRVTRALARGERVQVEGQVVSEAARPDRPQGRMDEDATFDPSNPASLQDGEQIYSSYEHALADGVLGVDDYLTRIEQHGTAGTLPPKLAEIYNGYRAGTKSEREYRRHAVDYALRETGRGAYVSPAWQESLIRTTLEAHERRKSGELASLMLVDPLSGESPDLTRAQMKANIGVTKETWVARREDGLFHFDDVYDFIADNIDELMLPDRLLQSYVTPSGRLALSVARNMEPKTPVKPTGGKRVKLPWGRREGDLLRDSGSADIDVTTPAGKVTLRGGFIDDSGGVNRFKKQVSNRGPDEAWADAVTDIEFARFAAESGRWVDVGPEDTRTYNASWERAVRLQLGKDDVAKQFLSGKSYTDVIEWMFNTSEGRAYHWRMGPWRSQFAENVAMVQAMVDTYLPVNPQRLEESKILREKALGGTATVDDLERVVSRDKMPKVHGATIDYATGRGPIMDKMKRAVDKAFEKISDLPNDKLARFPFANERYRLHVQQLAKHRGTQLERQHRGTQLERKGESFPVEDLRAIERQARRRALNDVQRYLFQTNATHDLAKSMRLMVPFGSALADSFLKWGLVLRENPTAGLNVFKVWNSPERNGLVQDQDGNELVVEDGEEKWYRVHPETGERTLLEGHEAEDRYISFRMPSWLSERYYGDDVQPQVRINKRVFQTFLDVPTAGPIISVPASRFSLDNPEFADNKFVKQWILPAGPSANESAIFIPSNLRNVRSVLFPNWAEQDRQTAEAQAISIFAADMTSHSLGQRPNPPTFEEAREKAAAMRGLRFWSAFGLGISPQIQSPYQPYVDYYRQLRLQESELRQKAGEEGRDQEEIPAADQKFYEEMGDEFFALTQSITRNAFGIPATIEADNAYKKYQDLMERHPDVATLIMGAEGGGEFSKAVYEAQKDRQLRPGAREKQRERLTMEESWDDMQKRRGWIEYQKMMDMVHNNLALLGLTDLSQVGAEQVKEARDSWLSQRMFVNSPWGDTVLNPWYQDFRTVDTSRMSARLHSMREIVQDSRLQGRDEIRGLAEYLVLRERFKTYMDRQGMASLQGDEARDLRTEWARIVFQLKDENLAFGSLHDRWLSADEFLEAR